MIRVCALKNEKEGTMASNWVKETLAKAGLVYNKVKSVWQPTHKLEWLGSDLDLGQGCISVPTRKISALKINLKEPVMADMLKAMVEVAGAAPSLTEVRLLAVCLVAFAGFMRCDELIKLKCEDITFNTESMVIRIVSK